MFWTVCIIGEHHSQLSSCFRRNEIQLRQRSREWRFTARWRDTLCAYVGVQPRYALSPRTTDSSPDIRVHRGSRTTFSAGGRRVIPRSRLLIQGWSRKPSPTPAKPRKCNRWFSFSRPSLRSRAIPRYVKIRESRPARTTIASIATDWQRNRIIEGARYYVTSAHAKCDKPSTSAETLVRNDLSRVILQRESAKKEMHLRRIVRGRFRRESTGEPECDRF